MVADNDLSTTITDAAKTIAVGCLLFGPSPISHFEGSLHSLASWRVVLSAAEVLAMYGAGAGAYVDLRNRLGAYQSNPPTHYYRAALADSPDMGIDYGDRQVIAVDLAEGGLGSSDRELDAPVTADEYTLRALQGLPFPDLWLASLILSALLEEFKGDADLIARGTAITAPRITMLPALTPADEIVDFQVPEIEQLEEISTSPRLDRRRIILQVTALAGAGLPDPETQAGDPGAAVLANVEPLAILVSKKLDTKLRELRNPYLQMVIGKQLERVDFESYRVSVATEGNRLLGAAVFRYALQVVVPEYFDVSTLDDLEGADVDYELWPEGARAPEHPHAQDDETLA
jgi:hypothetical protein